MTTITTRADALTSYHVTEEQIAKVTLESNRTVVQSATTEGVEYFVKYNYSTKHLDCSCPAANPPKDANGFYEYAPRGCWHRRASLAAIALNRLQAKERAARIAEAAAIEATPEYQAEYREAFSCGCSVH